MASHGAWKGRTSWVKIPPRKTRHVRFGDRIQGYDIRHIVIRKQPVLTQREQKRMRLVWTLQTNQIPQDCLVVLNFGELAAIDEDLSTCDNEVRDWEKDASTLLGELQDTNDKDEGECSRPEHTGEHDALWDAETLWYLTMFLCLLWDLSVFLSAILCTCPVLSQKDLPVCVPEGPVTYLQDKRTSDLDHANPETGLQQEEEPDFCRQGCVKEDGEE
ncbi:hypothetical protein Bbelb_067460 [Branchiostoma belcheri]|nr:hypothetical protein Bbelb_067460 [Branchiostoma belcheri]